ARMERRGAPRHREKPFRISLHPGYKLSLRGVGEARDPPFPFRAASRHSAAEKHPREPGVARIASLIDPASAQFPANGAQMHALGQELEGGGGEAAEGGPKSAHERHLERGKLLPRDRVMHLIDPGSPFLELSPLAANGMYEDTIHAAGIIT